MIPSGAIASILSKILKKSSVFHFSLYPRIPIAVHTQIIQPMNDIPPCRIANISLGCCIKYDRSYMTTYPSLHHSITQSIVIISIVSMSCVNAFCALG